MARSSQYLLWSRMKPSFHYDLLFSPLSNLENKIKRETLILEQICLGWSLSKINVMEEFDYHLYTFTNKWGFFSFKKKINKEIKCKVFKLTSSRICPREVFNHLIVQH